MRHVSRSPGRAGFTLVELLIAIVITGIVMAAMIRVLQGNQRFYTAQNQILEIQQNIRAVAQILAGELRELDASDGDIIAMSDTAIQIKAMRGFSVTCAPANATTGQVTIRNSQTFGFRAMDATRDSVLVFREGNVQQSSDDRWLRAPIAASAAASCTDGSAGTVLTLTGMAGTGGVGQLGPSGASGDQGVTVGSPVRTFEVVNYRLYDDGTGAWYLGVRSYASGAWSATSPVAGPLLPNTGMSLQFQDASGTTTTTTTAVRRILLTIRGRSRAPINIPGRRPGYFQDSLATRITPRNNARY